MSATQERRERKPINPKRIALVRDLRMLEAVNWPDDMSGEKFGHFCMVSGFPVEFFRQDDPPELEVGCCTGGDYFDDPDENGDTHEPR